MFIMLYPAANMRAVKLNVSMDQMKRVFHILFNLSAVQKYVMQWNVHPKLGRGCAVTESRCDLV